MNTLWVIVDAMRRTVEQPKGEHVPYRAPGQQPKSAQALSQRSPSPLSR